MMRHALLSALLPALLLICLSLPIGHAASQSTNESASCGVSQHFGDWTVVSRKPGIFAINVSLPGCNPPYRVAVTLLRDNGTLYTRDPVAGVVGGDTMTAKVYTGGYQDIMRMRVRDVGGRRRLVVDIHHDSLDAKPDGFSQLVFDRGKFAPPPPPPPRPIRALGKRTGGPAAATGTSAFGTGDWDGDGFADIIFFDRASGDLRLYPGDGSRGYSQFSPVTIGTGWQGYSPAGIGDHDGDGHADIVTRHDPSGDLFLYPGQSRRTPSTEPRAQIGNGWTGHTILGIGDWDKDGNTDVVTRRNGPEAQLMLYPGQGVRGYSVIEPVPLGITLATVIPVGMADWDGDGNLDIIGMMGVSRDLMLWPGNGRRAPLSQPPVLLGAGWKGLTPYGVTDWDKDGHPDIVMKEYATGDLWLYAGDGRRAVLNVTRVRIGNGW
jgi:hypothetical protein